MNQKYPYKAAYTMPPELKDRITTYMGANGLNHREMSPAICKLLDQALAAGGY